MPSQIFMYAHGAGLTVTSPTGGVVGLNGANTLVTPVASIAHVQFESPAAGVIKGLYVRVVANTLVTAAQTVTVQVGGVDTAQTVTIPADGSTGVFQVVTNTPVVVAAGNLISTRILGTGGTGDATYSVISVIYTINTPDTSVQLVSQKVNASSTAFGISMTTGTNNFTPLFGALTNGQTANTSTIVFEQNAVSYTYLRAYVQANSATSAASMALSTQNGTADTALVAVITALTTGEFLNTATTVAIVGGGGVSISFRGGMTSNTDVGTTCGIMLIQVQRNSRWSYIGTVAAGAFTSLTTSTFWPVGGVGTSLNSTEESVQVLARQTFNYRNIQVNIPVNAGGTTLHFRVNGESRVSVPISSGTVGLVVNSTTGSVLGTDTFNWLIDRSTAGVTGGFTLSVAALEMASLDTIPFRTLMGVGV